MGMPIITPSNVERKQAITDITESVALEQTALSHILNAEGEKIQKILAGQRVDDGSEEGILVPYSTQEILAVNRSVEKMLSHISRLELVLQAKLELFADSLEESTTTTITTEADQVAP